MIWKLPQLLSMYLVCYESTEKMTIAELRIQ